MGAGHLRPTDLTKPLGAGILALALAATPGLASVPPPPREGVVEAIRKASCPEDREPAHFTEVPVTARPLGRDETPKMRLADPRVRYLGGLAIQSPDPRVGQIAALSVTGRNGRLMGVTRDGSWLKMEVDWSKDIEPTGVASISAAPMLDARGAPVAAAGLRASGVGLTYPNMHFVSFEQPGGVRIYDFTACGPASRAVEHFRLEPGDLGPVPMTFAEYTYLIFALEGPGGLVTAEGEALRFQDDRLEPIRSNFKPGHIAPLPGYRLATLHNPTSLAWDILALWRGEGPNVGETRVQEMDLVEFLHFGRGTVRPPRDLVTIKGTPFQAMFGFRLGPASERVHIILMSDNTETPDKPVILLSFVVEPQPAPKKP